MYIYDYDNPFDWKTPSWNMNMKLYSDIFNTLLARGKSSMTETEALVELSKIMSKNEAFQIVNEINEKRETLKKEMGPEFDRVENGKEPKQKSASFWYSIYFSKKDGGGMVQFLRDAFPFETLFIQRF